MNIPIKLSICIATLNRGSLIGVTLDTIVSQLTDGVEVVIVDGASTDNTEEVVHGYQQRFANVRYFRLAAKGGVDQDYSRTVEFANGEYCWLFSDDDIIKPGGIETVLQLLENAPGLVIVNAEVRTAALTEVLKPRCVEISTNTTYSEHDSEALLRDTGNFLSFIGCVVIKRSLWLGRDKKSYFGTLFVHVGVIFQRPVEGGAVFLAEPMIAIRYGNAMWTDKGFEISLLKWPRLIWSFPGFSDASKNHVSEANPWRKISRLALFRAKGLYSLKEYRKFLSERATSTLQKIAFLLIALVPATLCNAVFYLYFASIGANLANAKLTLVDLENSRFNCKRFFPFQNKHAGT